MKLTHDSLNPHDYEIFFKLSNGLFCILGFDGSIKEFNDIWLSFLGLSKNEILSKPFIEFIYPDDRETTNNIINTLKEGCEIQCFENRCISSDGTIHWLRWNAVADKNRSLIYSFAVDITEEINSKLESENRNKMIIDIFSQAPCLTATVEGPDFIFAYANEMFFNLVGQRNIIGKSVKLAIPDIDPEVVKILQKVYTTGERFEIKDFQVIGDWRADGCLTEKFFTLVYSRFYDSHRNIYGIWTLAFETTNSKKLENLMEITERVAALGRMAAGVAHEINNPLSYILGSLNLLREKLYKINNEIRCDKLNELTQLTQNAENGILRIRDIVKSLKKLSSDNRQAGNETILINDILNTSLTYAHNEIKHRAKIHTDFEEELYVNGNACELNQVFLNLIINAGHSIGVGKIEDNEISITSRKGINGEVIIKIQDTGCGIPRENIGKIFDPFYTSKSSGEGTGLGLAICHKIIESVSGTIKVSSEVGVGTAFTITLKSVDKNEKKLLRSENIETVECTKSNVILSRPKILVIDDEEMIGDVISLILEEYDVVIFQNAMEAFSLIERGDVFNVILCDLMMPKMSGTDFYKLLEEKNYSMCDRVVFMSGGACTPVTEKFINANSNLKIEKPFTSEELRELIKNRISNEAYSGQKKAC